MPADSGPADTVTLDASNAPDAVDPFDVSIAPDALDAMLDVSIAPDAVDTFIAPDAPDASITWSRDWSAFPAVIQLPFPTVLYAVSDPHGGYARLIALLARHGLIAANPASPSEAHWTAGGATLVVTGDLFDKGPQGLEVIDLWRALQTSAAAAGGHVVVTLGNHEAEFLVNPRNTKATAADGVDVEIAAMGLVPEAIASTMDPRGRWMRTLPFAASVGGWFFAHAGDTHGRTVAALESALRAAVTAHDYNDPEIVGTTSILESRDWFATDNTIGARYSAALGVGHIVFGHDPSALGARGGIAHAQSGTLFRIDCGMSPDVNDSMGVLFRVQRAAGSDAVDALAADGTVTHEWTGAAP